MDKAKKAETKAILEGLGFEVKNLTKYLVVAQRGEIRADVTCVEGRYGVRLLAGNTPTILGAKDDSDLRAAVLRALADAMENTQHWIDQLKRMSAELTR